MLINWRREERHEERHESPSTPPTTFSNVLLQKPLKAIAVAMATFLLSQEPAALILSGHVPVSATQPVKAAMLNAVPLRFDDSQRLDAVAAHGLLHTHWEVRSIDSQAETMLVFSNYSASVVDLWWIDYCGCEVFYATIQPGTTHVQPSFVTHPWVVRDHISQNPVLMLVATQKPVLTVVQET